jgi:hypothetical protein
MEMSTAMPNSLRALRGDMVKVLFMLNVLLPFHLVCSLFTLKAFANFSPGFALKPWGTRGVPPY